MCKNPSKEVVYDTKHFEETVKKICALLEGMDTRLAISYLEEARDIVEDNSFFKKRVPEK